MSLIDISIFIVYFLAMLAVGFYFYRKNESSEDYFLGGRSMGSWHTGLSVVATDVGGGFSIGLGGLGFGIGLSGSWMLFTGLIGAWLSAVFLIPKIRRLPELETLFTFPQIFNIYFSKKVALTAGIITAIGYIGFSSSAILAGAKLSSATFESLDMDVAIIVMGIVATVYTTFGGLKAVIYTDTIQWLILIVGLSLIGVPLAYNYLGGYEVIITHLPTEFFRFDNIEWITLVNWGVTIIPIWFIGMTLYQRIYACRSEKDAKKAWFIAGLFEWPIMAFMGVVLGLLARVAYEQNMFVDYGFGTGEIIDAEMGLPLLLRHIFPIGLMGLMMSAYFSAIMSTADSCMMAASGNIVTDIIENFKKLDKKSYLKISQLTTFAVGGASVIIAYFSTEVLGLMLYSYSFMVSGLLIPLLGALFWKNSTTNGAFTSMLSGGFTTLSLKVLQLNGIIDLPLGLDPIIFGLAISLITFVVVSKYGNRKLIVQ